MSAELGHNSAVNGNHLRQIVERIERREEDKLAISEDIKEIYSEAKGVGFDVKILRKIVSLRKQDRAKRDEEAELLDLYMAAIEQPSLPGV